MEESNRHPVDRLADGQMDRFHWTRRHEPRDRLARPVCVR
jgi:hypothetical protein